MRERHGLILKDGKNKYQTNIIIFTESYANELVEKTNPLLEKEVKKIYNSMIRKLSPMRDVNFYGSTFTDNQLLWMGIVMLLFYHINDKKVLPYKELIPGCSGAAFGYDYKGCLYEKYLDAYAGFSKISNNLYATFINLHAFDDMKYQSDSNDKTELIEKIQRRNADFPVITCEEKTALLNILSPEIQMISFLYDELAKIATTILTEHSPAKLADKVKDYVHLDLSSGFLGMVPDMMIQQNFLSIPQNAHVGMYVNDDQEGVLDFYTKLQGGGNKLG